MHNYTTLVALINIPIYTHGSEEVLSLDDERGGVGVLCVECGEEGGGGGEEVRWVAGSSEEVGGWCAEACSVGAGEDAEGIVFACGDIRGASEGIDSVGVRCLEDKDEEGASEEMGEGCVGSCAAEGADEVGVVCSVKGGEMRCAGKDLWQPQNESREKSWINLSCGACHTCYFLF